MEAAEALAVVVRALRRRKGFTQENLITIDRSYWGRIERGEVNITIDVLIRLAAIMEVEPASLILMATSLQSNEPFGEGLKRISKQLNRIKKESVDQEMKSMARDGKPAPGRPVRSDAAQKAAEADRLRSAGVAVSEIAERLDLSRSTVRRYLKTTTSERINSE
ncbi:transcriptional regulator [Pseudomonas viridiflava]|jgi:transcriptional regulator with XRE-family HTH domain|uniref:Transcriptional regulator n=3 Tax=Pseudomonas TaxID=286 RepID=A0A8H9YNE8_9PSED|nr:MULTISPECIES: transcriptional regulator [Pseudomonas]MEE3937711.1 transcriptional regulator [Pseudomonas viridiflava]MBP2873729.1 transcriptional regulator [Pseudomonas sp. SWRI144]MEE4042511.1 transcriptional regulator [Pseudomonas viridiflava]MEE4062481.1 transcriptional regulator [Pseudomonas viridiflava]MEE4171861.1 transcriptional regulator [Pseudomonas viridiflava]